MQPDEAPPRRRSRLGLYAPFILLLLLAVGWSVFWFVARERTRTGYDEWVASEAAAGRLWSCADRVIGGYPFRLELSCSELAVSRPDVHATIGRVRVVSQLYKLSHIIAEATGPFRVQSFSPGLQSVFVRNEHYWRPGRPYLDELVIINFGEDDARINALLSSQVDAIDQVPMALVEVLRSDERLRVLSSETGTWLPFTMRVDRPPFDDVRVRQALRLVVDREQMVNQVLSRDVGIRINGVETTNVHEYDVAEGWVRVEVTTAKDRRGNPMVVKRSGTVEPFFRPAE